MGSRYSGYTCLVCSKVVYTKTHQHMKLHHNLTPEEYYSKYVSPPKGCKYCNTPTTLLSIKDGYREFCNRSCGGKYIQTQHDLVKHLKPYQKINHKYLRCPEVQKKANRGNKTPDALRRAEATRVKNGTRKKIMDILQTPEMHRKRTKALLAKNPNHFVDISRKGGFNGTTKGFLKTSKAGDVFYRSSWEKKVFLALDLEEKVLSFEVEPYKYLIPLPSGKNYKPDILIEYSDGSTFLIEVKPAYQMGQTRNLEKFKAAYFFCRENNLNWDVWNEHNCEYLLNENSKKRKDNTPIPYTSFRCDNP